MSLTKEWTWNENGSASGGQPLYTDKVGRWVVDWSDWFGTIGSGWPIDEFRTTGTAGGIPASGKSYIKRYQK